jgi:hypothetical protein
VSGSFPPPFTPLGGDLLLRQLRHRGIRHLISLPGAQLLSTWDAMARLSGVDLVVPHSEGNGVLMAEGYGRVAKRPAAVFDTVGPGVANEVLGAVSAERGGSPVLFVSPRQPGAVPPLPGFAGEIDKRKRIGSVVQGLRHEQHLDLHTPRRFAAELLDEMARTLDDAVDLCLSAQKPVRLHLTFPLLFELAVWLPGPAPAPAPLPASDGVLALEVKGDGEPWRSRIFPGESPLVIAPGIDRAGWGMPFALGARLARDDAPAVLVTTAARFLAALDSVVLAKCERRIPVHVVEMGTSPGDGVARASRALQAVHHPSPTDAELRQIVHGDPQAWTIVCA